MGVGAAADTSSADVSVVVELVGGAAGGIVAVDGGIVPVPVVPCWVVTVVELEGELGVVTVIELDGELGVVTVVVVEPLEGTVLDVVPLVAPADVLSAMDALARVVVAIMVALTIKSL